MSRHILTFACILGIVWLLFRVFRRAERQTEPGVRMQVRTTREGWIFFFLAVCVLGSALHTGVNLIYLTFAVLASALLLSYLLVRVAAAAVMVERSFPEEVVVGEPFAGKVTISNRSSLLPIYCLAVSHELPGRLHSAFGRHLVFRVSPGKEVAFDFPVLAVQRGTSDLTQFSFGTSFPFGLFERRGESKSSAAGRHLLALPRLGTLRRQWLERIAEQATAARRGVHSDSIEDFFGLREYRPGDNPKWIHWKTTARQQKPMLREHGDQHRQRILVALHAAAKDNPDPEDERELETAVSFASTIVQELCRGNCHVAFIGNSDPVTYLSLSSGPSHFHSIRRKLALFEPSSDISPDELLSLSGSALHEFDRIIFVAAVEEAATPEGYLRRLRDTGCPLDYLEVGSQQFGSLFQLPPLDESLTPAGVSGGADD